MIPASRYPNRFGKPSLRIIIANTTPTKIIIAKLNNITLSPYIKMLMPVTKRSYRSYQHLSRFRFIILENPISVRNYSSDSFLCQKEIPASCRGILAGITDFFSIIVMPGLTSRLS